MMPVSYMSYRYYMHCSSKWVSDCYRCTACADLILVDDNNKTGHILVGSSALTV
jgi:hypothetical protein